jgi:aspartate-semialdehyde dehydrogenase
MTAKKIPVGILGATGSVGQKFIELLNNHPWFTVNEVAASERSAGKKYSEATNWIMATPLNNDIAEMVIKPCDTNLESKILFSALDSSVAGGLETEFAEAGYIVISNSKNHRQDTDVPLMIPEVNPDHLELMKTQKTAGAIITNPNCSTIGLVLALKPIHDAFGIKDANVVTLQAISGSGYPGLPSMDILDNVIPFIGGEEDKVEYEPLKILGKFNKDRIDFAEINISAQCNRVGVIDGHLECVQLNLEKQTSVEEIKSVLDNFKSVPQELNLPFAPEKPIEYLENPKHPQPRIHRNAGNGMTVSVGRLREDNMFQYKFVVLSHNTVRGAAGGTILVAELMKAKGYLDNVI